MSYAEVCVNAPFAGHQTFTYHIPEGLTVQTGQVVRVPFGERILQGVVFALSQISGVEETRDILATDEVYLAPYQLELAKWLSDYYLCSLFEATALMLPPAFVRSTVVYLRATEKKSDGISADEEKILKTIRLAGEVELRDLEKSLGKEKASITVMGKEKASITVMGKKKASVIVMGKKKASVIVNRLIRSGLIERVYRLKPPRVKPKKEQILVPVGSKNLEDEIKKLGTRANKQKTILEVLIQKPEGVSLKELREKIDLTRPTVSALVKKGLIAIREVEVKRTPAKHTGPSAYTHHKLTSAQEEALKEIKEALRKDQGAVFMLYGVTGSGKTEVYLEAMAEAERLGKSGMVLVPEIALTPQTIEQFLSRFPEKVAVMHSRMSLGEQFDEWRSISQGDYSVVIGARSALFSPLPNPGLIIIDEEQEWTYKQDTSPRYHARDVAIKMAELTGAVVILGSATPDVSTYYQAQRGNFKLLQLPERVSGLFLPQVELVDMRNEFKKGNRSLFSQRLRQLMELAINNNEQIILFYNRRGSASFVQCRHCGFVWRCRRCEVALTYHAAEEALICHQCNYRIELPKSCPRCSSSQIKFLGGGTQKLEQEVDTFFPDIKTIRWDSDTTRGRLSHQEILESFRKEERAILIGTQMIAKGLDIPGVTLVGVINADTSLHLPDFRSAERTFQLLTQVAGRAGRGPRGGRVIIQTFSSDHYAVIAAAHQDYDEFYKQEIEFRRRLAYPPFSRMVRLTYSHTNNQRSRSEAMRVRKLLEDEGHSRGDVTRVIGPAPAFIPRLKGKYRWQVILKGQDPTELLRGVRLPPGWVIDVDFYGLD